MSANHLIAAIALLAVCAVPAAAQTRLSPRGYVTYGSTVFSSKDSFEAVTGESSKTGIGVGGAFGGIWRGLFVDGVVSQRKLAGERVFIDAGIVYKLGTPVTITTRPVDLAAGWRFVLGRLSPYAGAGVSFISYKETAEFAVSGDDVSDSKSGAMFLGGLDVAVVKWLHAGAEFRYRSVEGVLGDRGVSEVFGENNLGGYAFAVRISVGR